jgi:hypothetical protein
VFPLLGAGRKVVYETSIEDVWGLPGPPRSGRSTGRPPNILPGPATRILKRIKAATWLGRACWISNPLAGRAGSSMDFWRVGSAEASPAGPVFGNAAAGGPITAG